MKDQNKPEIDEIDFSDKIKDFFKDSSDLDAARTDLLKANVDLDSEGDMDLEDLEYSEASNKTLNKPFRTPKGPKKFSVYVKNEKGNVVKVNFGDPNMEIKRDDPARRRSFRARHKCDGDNPKWKARYWSCKMWSNKTVTDLAFERCAFSDETKAKMEDYIFSDKDAAIKKSKEIGFNGDTHETKTADGQVLYFPAKTEDEFISWYRKNDPNAEEELSKAEFFNLEIDIQAKHKGLWYNIQQKKKRMGKNYRPAKPGSPERPSQDALKKAQGSDYDNENYEWDGETEFEQNELLKINPSLSLAQEVDTE